MHSFDISICDHTFFNFYSIIDSLTKFSDSVDVFGFSNSSYEEKFVFSFDTYALQLHDIEAGSFKGKIFIVDLGSVEEAIKEEGIIKNTSLKTSAMIMDILDNWTAAVEIPKNFISDISECKTGQSGGTQRLIHYVFLTDILFQSPKENASDIGSVILSTEIICVGNKSLSSPITVNLRTSDKVCNNNIIILQTPYLGQG